MHLLPPKIGEVPRADVELIRSNSVKVEPCMFCFTTGKVPDTPLLQIAGMRKAMSVCPFHEGELLMVLLKNYLRRVRRGRKSGYVGPLFKPEVLPVTSDDVKDDY